MARWVVTPITLTANQAAGIDPILAAETMSGGGGRIGVIVANPGATVGNLHVASGQTQGTGLPLAAGSMVVFSHALPGLDNALYVTGFAAGDKLSLWVS